MSNGITHILLVDDDPHFATVLRHHVSASPNLRLLGVVSSSVAALRWLADAPTLPDLTLINFSLDGGRGLALVAPLRSVLSALAHATEPRPQIAMLGLYDEHIYAQQSALVGADAFIAKNCFPDQLLHVLQLA